jgi:alkylated DNA repair dioxygenase AlkB
MTDKMFKYIPNFMNKMEEYELFNYLENTNDFVPTPQFSSGFSRFQKWYQTENKYFCPMWRERYPQWESFKIDSMIKNIINIIQNYINDSEYSKKLQINSCLVNKYPNGDHFIAPHRDSQESFGEEPIIIILSLGDTRTLSFENKEDKISFELESGSLFIMSGNSQKSYLHSLLKSSNKNVRYSLTFREFIL